MAEIAQDVQNKKSRMKLTTTSFSRFGKHFVECTWLNPDAKDTFECCVCYDIQHQEYLFIQLFESLGPERCGEDLYNRLMEELKGSKPKAVTQTSVQNQQAHTI